MEDNTKKKQYNFLQSPEALYMNWKPSYIYIYISKDQTYITEDQLSVCLSKIETIGKLLNGFIRYDSTKKE